MRKLMLVAAGVAAMTIAGFAVGKGLDSVRSARALAGTFSATTVTETKTTTCTTTDGKTISITKARYSGTAAGDADLAGPITLNVRAVINTTDGVGVVDGKLRIDVAAGDDTVARFTSVYDHGTLAGLATGRAHEPSAKLVGNLSATFSAAAGFTGGKIGGGTAAGAAVELGPARCSPPPGRDNGKGDKGDKRDRDDDDDDGNEAQGTVSAVSSISITVSGLTCAVPERLAEKVKTILAGSRVEIRCAPVGGQTTLVKFEQKRR